MKLSEKFDLKVTQLELDFIDIDLDKDCPLYIDPFLIANINCQWAIQTDRVIKNFFNEFKLQILNNEYDRAEELLQFMAEPKETCLGISKKGTMNGRGVGKLNAKGILEKIVESNAIEKGLLKNIEDITIFVDDIDRDKLSDMVTNIIRKKLIEYTQSQCKLWNIELVEADTLPYWNPVDSRWVYSSENLLVIDKTREILLVPKSIVSAISIYDISKYKWNFVVEQERNLHLQRRMVRINTIFPKKMLIKILVNKLLMVLLVIQKIIYASIHKDILNYLLSL